MSVETFLCFFLLFLVSSASACDRCVHQTKVVYYHDSAPLSSGACEYGSLALGFNNGLLAGGAPSLYKNGAGCGACFQVRCKNNNGLCSQSGTRVFLFDLNRSNQTGFVLSNNAFVAMANKGKGTDLLKLGIVDVEYKRVPCEYPNKNLAVLVNEFSHKYYLAIKFLYLGGQTEIVSVDIATVDSSNWTYMTRNHGAVWNTSRVPRGPLQFRMVVTAGYDGKTWWAKNVLPANWKPGAVYDTRIQITDIAQEPCSPCDDGEWGKHHKYN